MWATVAGQLCHREPPPSGNNRHGVGGSFRPGCRCPKEGVRWRSARSVGWLQNLFCLGPCTNYGRGLPPNGPSPKVPLGGTVSRRSGAVGPSSDPGSSIRQNVVVDDEAIGSKAQERLDILSGLLDAINRLDEINAAVRRSTDRIEARRELQSEPFGYSDAVINHILDLTVGKQTADGVAELKRDRDALVELLKRLE